MVKIEQMLHKNVTIFNNVFSTLVENGQTTEGNLHKRNINGQKI